MARTENRFASLLVAAALISPAATMAGTRWQDNNRDRDDAQGHRVYDSQHKDYHNWNNDEDKQWHVYVGTEHKKYHDYDKANKKEQADYWKWRHDHDEHGH